MHLTQEEFCMFNQSAKLQMVKEFGVLVHQVKIKTLLIRVFKICDFHLEIISDHTTNTVAAINIISKKMLHFYYTM